MCVYGCVPPPPSSFSVAPPLLLRSPHRPKHLSQPVIHAALPRASGRPTKLALQGSSRRHDIGEFHRGPTVPVGRTVVTGLRCVASLLLTMITLLLIWPPLCLERDGMGKGHMSEEGVHAEFGLEIVQCSLVCSSAPVVLWLYSGCCHWGSF